MNIDLRKTYYYVICLITFFVLLWGIIDLAGAASGLTLLKPEAATEKELPEAKNVRSLEESYQRRMLFDRLGDSLIRIVVSGAVFAYSRKKAAELEKEQPMYPEDLKYTKEHEWVKVEGKTGTIGITHYAQDSLGDIVYVELPKTGAELKQHQEFGVVESVKSVSSLYSPVSGKVVDVNSELSNNSAFINQDPYGKGWMIKIEISSPDEISKLLSAKDYQATFLRSSKSEGE